MKTYICVNKETGRMAGTWGPSESAPPTESDAFRMVDAALYPDFTPFDTLNLATGKLIKGTPPAPVKRLSKFDFMALLTSEEFLQLQALAQSDAELRYALAMLDLATHVEPAHPLVTRMLNHVEQLGVMTPARRLAFSAAVNDKAV